MTAARGCSTTPGTDRRDDGTLMLWPTQNPVKGNSDALNSASPDHVHNHEERTSSHRQLSLFQ